VLTLENPFWRFSLAIYAAPGVAAECLDLQNRIGIDVNVLLFCAYMGSAHNVALGENDLTAIDKCARDWHDKAVRPLRAARRDIKSMPAMADPYVKALRAGIAKCELSAEQVEQTMLFEIARELVKAGKTTSAAEAIRHNVSAYLTCMEPCGGNPELPERLVAQAIAYTA
jgi:uncharacterized protein (TIGR02444 family)